MTLQPIRAQHDSTANQNVGQVVVLKRVRLLQQLSVTRVLQVHAEVHGPLLQDLRTRFRTSGTSDTSGTGSKTSGNPQDFRTRDYLRTQDLRDRSKTSETSEPPLEPRDGSRLRDQVQTSGTSETSRTGSKTSGTGSWTSGTSGIQGPLLDLGTQGPALDLDFRDRLQPQEPALGPQGLQGPAWTSETQNLRDWT
ncbi:hypothetical protein WMY93_015303 [Mugilogobius chulae]|uniref:Uncharacterized protein n=1 Tax=Mugilogobius chulae TaxID=88201 RepID=A0AAW0P028_9GOBI